MPRSGIISCSMIALAFFGTGTSPRAGGRLQMPTIAKVLASHAACAAEMESLAAEDGKAVEAKTTASDGTTREVTLQTEGMQRLAPDRLRYEATLWFHHGKMRADLGQMEISHSFEKTTRECEGRTLMIQDEGGFTLSTFDPPVR